MTGGCFGPSDCSGATPVCELSTHACVECVVSDDCPAQPAQCLAQVCGASGVAGWVKLGRGATLVGRVLGFEGKPLGGPAVTVGVRALDRAAENYPVRADGTFEVSGLTPGKVTVAAELEEGRASTLQRVVLVEGKRLELELRFTK